jgi:membrane-associated protease RseP (regulator of RpoE activity)
MTGIGVGGPSFSFVTRGGELKIGDVTVDRPLTMFNLDKGGSGAAEASPSNIGGGILKRFVVTLDYSHYVMYLKPVSRLVADLDAFDHSGMWINCDEGGFKIAYISAGAPAEKAGLKAGDIIVAVDGTPASELHLYNVREWLRDAAPGTVVRLSIRRSGESKQFAITLRDLI